LAARRLRAFASAGDSLLTTGLIGRYDCQQGADPDVVYDLLGNYNAARGNGGSYKPAWTAQGLNFAGPVQLVNFPVGLSNALRTDMWCLKVVRGTGDYQNISADWHIHTDGRIVSGSIGGFTFSPSEVQLGNIIVTTTHSGSATKMYFGTREAVSYQNAGNVNPAGQTWWGYHNYGAGFQGYLYYRLCWDVELTAAQVASQARWMAQQVTPRSVAIGDTASGPYIACCGDSITSGQPGAVDNDWPKKLLGLLSNPSRIVCYGESGSTLANLATAIGASVGGIFSLNSGGTNVAIIARGTNDILVSGTPAATIVSTITTAVSNARAAGATHVIVRTIPRANWTSYRTQISGDAILVAANDAIVAGATGADVVADTWTSGPLGVGGDTTDTSYYFGDGIHLSSGGHTVTAQAVETALGTVGIT